MKAISSANKANVISSLSGHSIRKVEFITGLGKPTVGRIYQELEMDGLHDPWTKFEGVFGAIILLKNGPL